LLRPKLHFLVFYAENCVVVTELPLSYDKKEEGGGKTNQKKINHRNAIWRSNIELQNSLFLPKNAEIFFDCV
jgi:hypothetical protein